MRDKSFAGILLLLGTLAATPTAHTGDNATSQHRAGNPQSVAPWARPSDDGHYVGYWVGGGRAVGGRPASVEDGTWGWDYGGLYFPKRVGLSWGNGWRPQGGTGAYKTDGPKLESPREAHGTE